MFCKKGEVMCQLCFECITFDECYPLPNGKREDVCLWCVIDEAYYENWSRDNAKKPLLSRPTDD